MDEREQVRTVAYCGLVCGVCVNAAAEKGGCVGCRRGGGAEDCYQRKCCVEHEFVGCWQCQCFRCDKGFFADEAWRGLCIGSVQCIKERGIEGYVEALVSRLGHVVEYGE